MLAKLRSILVSIYIHLAGVRFYSTETLPVKQDIRKFVVKTLHGYEITFTFYKEKLNFTQYVFRSLRKRNCTIYAVTAHFDKLAPESVRRYNSVRIFVRDSLLFLSDEDSIIMTLLNVYLDYLLHEMNDRTDVAPMTSETKDPVDEPH